MKFTDATVRALPPSNGQTDYYDDAIPGFYVRVGRKAKTFFLATGTGANRRRYTIGRYSPPHFTLAMARERAKDLAAEHRLAPPERVKVPTFEDAYKTFCTTHESKNRTSTRKAHLRLVKAHWVPLYDIPLDRITTGQIINILDQLLDTPAEANHAFVLLRTIFNWAVKRRLLDRSPMQGLDKPAVQAPRTRVLAPGELTAIWLACDTPSHISANYTIMVKLLLLTGQRRSQIATLRADQIDREKLLIHWTGEQMKGRREHILPYGNMVAQIFDMLPRIGILLPSPTGIIQPHTGYKKMQLDKLVNIPSWTLHDLRRSWATISAEELGCEPHIIEAILSHQSGTAVARTYNRARYLEPMRRAMLAFEEWLQVLLSKSEAIDGRRNIRDVRTA